MEKISYTLLNQAKYPFKNFGEGHKGWSQFTRYQPQLAAPNVFPHNIWGCKIPENVDGRTNPCMHWKTLDNLNSHKNLFIFEHIVQYVSLFQVLLFLMEIF